jgi:zinc finger SWIM domain-containing protein 3
LNIQNEDENQNEDQSHIPYVGMRFSSLEEAFKFYNDYALRVGFSVRKSSQTISKQGLSSKRFVCSKEGLGKREKNMEMPIESLNKQKTPEKEKGFTRVQCKACFRVRLMGHGEWEVSVFEEKHNHSLISSPSKNVLWG